jgi:hypothetical protein
LAGEKKRDIYGNWVSKDDEEEKGNRNSEADAEREIKSLEQQKKTKDTSTLEWKDYIAITIASLETFLLPIIILIAVLLFLVLILAIIH